MIKSMLFIFGILFSFIGNSFGDTCMFDKCVDSNGKVYDNPDMIIEGDADYEWDPTYNSLTATYYIGKRDSYVNVNCTVEYNSKVIAGGNGFTSGGVAIINISVPKKYKDDPYINVRCSHSNY